MNIRILSLAICMSCALFPANIVAQEDTPQHDVVTHDVSKYNVTWNKLGTDENSSMPIGNGEVAANVWTEQNGDIVLLLARTDAWSENQQLLKVGQVRVSITPNPFVGGKTFTQTLRLEDGSVVLSSGNERITIYADANSPVVRIKTNLTNAVNITAKAEIWRDKTHHLTQAEVNKSLFNYWDWRGNPDGMDFLADTVLNAGKDNIAWCHFNSFSMYPTVLEREHLGELLGKYPDPLLNRCFGIVASGNGFGKVDNKTIALSKKQNAAELNLYVITEQATSPKAWLGTVLKQIKLDNKIKPAVAQKQHEQWWSRFWNRSWIEITGSEDAEKVSQGYAINRFMTACTARGQYPMKFNGSLFTVGHYMPDGEVSTLENHDPDFRDWGGCYWNQNTRHLYYPLVATGDYEMNIPWFNLYTNALDLAKDKTRLYFNHGGASYIETMTFYGLPNLMDFGWNNKGNDPESHYMRWHYQGVLEVLVQMLDYYDYTQDRGFVANKLLPFGEAITTFYNEHWKRGADGKILFDPSQSIEMYQVGVVNDTPAIAGLLSVVPRLQALPGTTTAQQTLWKTLLADLPEIPIGTTQDGKMPTNGKGDKLGLSTILPAAKYGKPANGENPELYTVFPYRNFALGKPKLQLAINTYYARRYPFNNCWGQDGMEAALLGLTDDARAAAVHAMTTYGTQEFKWFWAKVADYSPDMDNGGTGMTTLQLMLLQCDGDTMRLLPAWPTNWTANFKLHAPKNTTVEGRVENGKLTKLNVFPAERQKDLIIGK